MSNYIEIRVPITKDGYEPTDPDSYLTFVLYDDTSEECQQVDGTFTPLVLSHVQTMMEDGQVVITEAEVPEGARRS